MAGSRVMKNVMRSAKAPKSGMKVPGDSSKGVMHAEKQYKQTGNKKNPKSQSGKNDYDGDENMKLIV